MVQSRQWKTIIDKLVNKSFLMRVDQSVVTESKSLTKKVGMITIMSMSEINS